MNVITTVHILDDKYAIKHEDGLNIRATRYGEPWREFIGDKLMYMLVTRFAKLEEENRKMRKLLQAVLDKSDSYISSENGLNRTLAQIHSYLNSLPR